MFMLKRWGLLSSPGMTLEAEAWPVVRGLRRSLLPEFGSRMMNRSLLKVITNHHFFSLAAPYVLLRACSIFSPSESCGILARA